MKKIILILFVFLSFAAQAFQLSYVYYSNGYHRLAVTNSMNCVAEVRINWLRGGIVVDTVISVNPLSTVYADLPGEYVPGQEIKAKSDGLCSSNGWFSTFQTGFILSLENPILARPPRIDSWRTKHLYTFLGQYVGGFGRDDLLPKGRYLVRQGDVTYKIQIL